MDTPKITLRKGHVTDFEGDAIIIPSDVELTNKKASSIVQRVLETNNDDLLKEISSIGYCEIGNAVITQGYSLKVKHLIFLPYCDSDNEENKADFILLHQAFRSAFNLASLYKVKTIAIPIFRFKVRKRNFIDKSLNLEIFGSLFGQTESKGLKDNEIEDIIISVISEFKNTSIEELCLFN